MKILCNECGNDAGSNHYSLQAVIYDAYKNRLAFSSLVKILCYEEIKKLFLKTQEIMIQQDVNRTIDEVTKSFCEEIREIYSIRKENIEQGEFSSCPDNYIGFSNFQDMMSLPKGFQDISGFILSFYPQELQIPNKFIPLETATECFPKSPDDIVISKEWMAYFNNSNKTRHVIWPQTHPSILSDYQVHLKNEIKLRDVIFRCK